MNLVICDRTKHELFNQQRKKQEDKLPCISTIRANSSNEVLAYVLVQPPSISSQTFFCR